MKKINFLIVALTLFIGCASQKKPYNLKAIKKKQSYVNGDFKSIDTSLLGSYKRIYIHESVPFIKNNNQPYVLNIGEHEKFYRCDAGTYCLAKYNEKQQLIKMVKISMTNNVLIEVSEKIDSTFRYVELYYPNGNILQKGVGASKYNFPIGKIYKFNRNGDLTEMIDTDEGYLVPFTEILKFCKSENLPNEHISISRYIDDNGQKMWHIDIKYHWGDEIYMINGITGKVTKRLVKLYLPGYENVPFQPKKKIRAK